jgi:hypothetical protein
MAAAAAEKGAIKLSTYAHKRQLRQTDRQTEGGKQRRGLLAWQL